jgi:hypothetical protein
MLKSKLKLYHFLVAFSRLSAMIVLINLLLIPGARGQSADEYDEVPVHLTVQRVGSTEISALIRGQTAYLPVSEIFDYLKIANTPSPSRDTLSGFLVNQGAPYLIDKINHRIRYKNKVYTLRPIDFIKTNTGLYLASGYFGKIFSLNCLFSFRNLSVVMNTEVELPILREMRLEQMRNNLSQLKGEVKADTVIKRTYPAFHFGAADWSVVNTQETNVGTNTRINVGLGGVVAGGETDVFVNYNSATPLKERDQYYLWRLANNDNPLLRQVMAGKIYGQSISSIYAPIVGVQLTNTPTTYRRSFGSYTISNITQPNWIVELYVNNVLVNYVRADAAGLYTFEVPLVYGNSQVKLRFYGPSGEERSTEQNISIPFNFLPKHEFEYTASAGVVEDGFGSRFSRLSTNYGLTSSVTIGGGTEYLSSVTSGATMPFVNSSARLFKNLLLSGEYAYGVRSRAIASYRFPSGLQLEINDTWYKKGQTAINNTFSEERKVIVSTPIRGAGFSAYTRFTFDQIILPVTRYTTAEWLFSAAVWNLNATVNTYALFTQQSNPYLYSNISLAARLPKGFLFTQQVQYEYSSGRFIGFKEELERRVFRNGYFNISYENNIFSHLRTLDVGLRYDFSFAQTGTSVRKSNYSTRYLQTANGSLIVDRPTKYLGINNHTSIGKGGITIIPFLDLNHNGKRDLGEPRAAGLKLHVNGGRIEQNTKDTTVRITDLEAYISYTVELDPLSFENIAWHVSKQRFSVAIDPNMIKVIDVPILVYGEASGKVGLKSNGEVKGQSRIVINFYRGGYDKISYRTLTEADGYFTYLGLAPGDYTAAVDSAQMKKLHFSALPASIKFNIRKSTEGAIVGGLEFTLTDSLDGLDKPSKSIEQTIAKVPHQNNTPENKAAAKDTLLSKAGGDKEIKAAAGKSVPGLTNTTVVNNKLTKSKLRKLSVVNRKTKTAATPGDNDVNNGVANTQNKYSRLNKAGRTGRVSVGALSTAARRNEKLEGYAPGRAPNGVQHPAAGQTLRSSSINGTTRRTTDRTTIRKKPDHVTVNRIAKHKHRINKAGTNNAHLNKAKAKNDATAKRDVKRAVSPFEYDITIQVAHFKYRNAKASVKFLHRRFGYISLMRHAPHHYYNVRITGVKDIRTARAIIRKIRRRGYPDAYILARRRPAARN